MDPHPPSSRLVHCLGNKPVCGVSRSVKLPSTGAEKERMKSGTLRTHRQYSAAVAAVANRLRAGHIGPDVVTPGPNHKPATADPSWQDKFYAQ